MLFFALLVVVLSAGTNEACQALGVGCSDVWTCCASLTCVKVDSTWGFCQNDTAAPTQAPAAPSTTRLTTRLSQGTTRTTARVSGTTTRTTTRTTRSTTRAAGITTTAPRTSTSTVRCRGQNEGCTDVAPCCGGFICAKDDPTSYFGFCMEATPPPETIPTPPMPANPLVTQAEFMRAVTINGYPSPTTPQYVNFIARAGPAGRITTRRELAMFLANILHESDGLRAKREYGPPPADWYVYPALDVPGQTYYGRGYIQLTWSYNYAAASLALYGDNRLLTDSDQVAKNETVAWDVSFWYWSARVHDRAGISAGQFGVSIRAINGGIECGPEAPNKVSPRKRFDMYKKIFELWGIAGVPDERGCWN